MKNESAEAIFRPAMVLMSGRFLGFAAAFVIPLVLARVFTQEEFGTYKQLFLIYGTLFAIAQLGMAESLYYFLPDSRRGGGGYIRNTQMMLLAIGLLAFALLWLLREPVAGFLNNPRLAEYVPYVGLILLFMLGAAVLEIVMTARRQHFAAGTAYALSDLARALLYVTPVLLFGTLEWLMLGAVLFAAGRFLVTLGYLGSGVRGSGQEEDRRGQLKRHLSYALPFGVAGMIEILQINYHLFAVSYFFDTATFAIYAVGCLQIPLTDFLMTSTANVMMVNMRRRVREGRLREAHAIWHDAMRKLALVLFPLVGLLVLLAHELIVLLFTSSYERSVPVFMVYSMTTLMTVLLTDGVLRVFAETRFLILQNLLRLAIIAALIQWFMQGFGLIGAILVTGLASLAARALALARLKKVMDLRLGELLPWQSLGRVAAMTVAAAIPVLLLKAVLPMTLLPALLAGGLIYTLTYYFLLLRLGPMHEEEKRMLVNWLEMPFSRLFRSLKELKV